MSDSQALSILMKSPVTHDMVAHIVNVTLKVIQCKKSKVYPSPPSSPNGKASSKPLPSLMTFISRLVRYSNVYTGTLLCTLVYLDRLAAKLPKNAEGLPCTLHRIFLAALVISAKFNNDSSPKNKHWAKYTDGLFRTDEVNLMERQMLQLMNWDVIVSEAQLAHALRRFTEPIKQDLKKAARVRRSISKQRLHQQQQQQYPPSPPQMAYQTPSPSDHQHMRSLSASSISSLSSTASSSCYPSDDEMMSTLLNAQQMQYYHPQTVPTIKTTEMHHSKIMEEDDDVFLTSLWGDSLTA